MLSGKAGKTVKNFYCEKGDQSWKKTKSFCLAPY
jgi:hypothetical protein